MSLDNLHSVSFGAEASKTNVLTTDIETGSQTNEAGERPEKKFCPVKMREWMRLEFDHLIEYVRKEQDGKSEIKVYKEKADALYRRLKKKAEETGIKIAEFKNFSTIPEKFDLFYQQIADMQ